MRHPALLVSIPLAIFLSLGAAHAGAVFFPGTYEGGAFTPTADADTAAVLYSAVNAHLSADGVKARTEDTVAATAASAHLALIPLPMGTASDAVVVRVDGVQVRGTVLDAKGAQSLYTTLAAARDVSRLMPYANRPVFVAQVKLGTRSLVTTEMAYPVRPGALFDAQLPLPLAGLSKTPVRRITVDATITGLKPLRGIFSPTHAVEVTRPDVHTARVRLSADAVRETEDLRLLWAIDDDAVGLRVLTHRPEGSQYGWFMLLGNPTGDGPSALNGAQAKTSAQPKDVLLVVDTSGSMRGEKLGQVQLAVEYIIDKLGAEDRVNIIAFGSAVQRFSPDVVPATADNRVAAKTFVRGLLAEGKTNISAALKAGLAGKADATRPRMMLFLTDGAPTAGEMNPDTIVARLPALNTASTRVFAIGVGHDVNAHLLDSLARDTAGRSVYFKPDDAIDVQVAALYDGLSHPVLTDVQVDFGGLSVDHPTPKTLGSLFRGQEVLLLGRYSGGGTHTISLKGSLRGAARTFDVTAEFPTKPAVDDAFIAWIWASRRIGDLLAEIRLEGQTQDRVAEVVRLSHRFGIITEYTAFISQANTDFTPKEANEEAAKLMKQANRNASGRWAVNQADNDQQLATRTVSSAMSNMYRDRQGKVVQAQKVKTVGGRTFYERKGTWVQSGSTAKKSRRVKKFSPEYFKLVRDNKDFARAQFEDANTVMDVGDTAVETY